MNNQIINIEDAYIPSHRFSDTALEINKFTLREGEVVLIRTEPEAPILPLADAITGLTAASRGKIQFHKTDLYNASEKLATEHRSRIGRIFDSHGWVNNLSMYENIVISQQYFRSISHQSLDNAIRDLITELNIGHMEGKMPLRPSDLGPRELQQAGWIRCLLGERKLYIMERPARYVTIENAERFCKAIDKRVFEGRAALWISDTLPNFEWKADSRLLEIAKNTLS